MLSDDTSFRQISSERILNYTVNKWINDATGFSVASVKTPTSRLQGSFVVATEAHDNLGCPHTLEHLCFMGSKKYPMNGILTKFAGRACGDINACTDVDYTSYELSAAEEDGFLRLLPVFADHILSPILSDEAFCTEVYHINGMGEESGVVYSEMQNTQSSETDVMFDCMRTSQYPVTSGYYYETGGHPSELRKLSIEKIREYHKEMYVPSNICLIVTGCINESRLLSCASGIVKEILANGIITPPTWTRPWCSTNVDYTIPEPILKTVKFSSEDEYTGSVSLAWNGPSALDAYTVFAIETLCEFLSESAVSPFGQTFVEIEDPFCSFVYFYVSLRVPCSIQLFFDSVPLEKINGLEQRALRLLAETKQIDMNRMKDYLKTRRDQYLTNLEAFPSSLFMKILTLDHVYGSREGKDLPNLLKMLEYNRLLEEWEEKDWLKLLKKWFVENNSVTVIALPSFEMAENIKKENAEQLNKRRCLLGASGLEKLAEKLKKSKEKNEQKLSVNLISSFRISDPESIRFYSSTTARTRSAGQPFDNEVQTYIDTDVSSENPFIQFDHIDSSFVQLATYIDTSMIPSSLKPYLSVFAKYIEAAPALLSGTIPTPYHEVVKQLERDTVSLNVSLSFDTSSCGYAYYETKRELLSIEIKVTRENYEKGVYWIRNLLAKTVWDRERMLSVINQQLADIPFQKRDAEFILPSYFDIRLYNDCSLKYSLNTLSQEKILRELRDKLQNDHSSIFDAFQKMRNYMLQHQAIRIHVIGDILKLPQPISTWNKLLGSECHRNPNMEFLSTFSKDYLKPQEFGSSSSLTVIPMPSNESSDLVFSIPGITSWLDPSLPVIVLIANYLGLMDGPFWNTIRGSGLAYGFNMSIDVDGGVLYYCINTSPDVYKAWASSRDLVKSLISGEVQVSSFDLESAKCVSYSIVSELENNAIYSSKNSFTLLSIKGLNKDEDHKFLEKVKQVTLQQFLEGLKIYCLPFFSSSNNLAVITSSLAKIEQTVEQFTEEGFNVNVESLHEIQGIESESEDDLSVGGNDDN